MLNDLNTIGWLGPEMLLVGVATILMVAGAFRRWPWGWLGIALGAYVAAAALLCAGEAARWWHGEPAVWSGPLLSDPLGFVLRHIALLAGLLLTLSVSRQLHHRLQTEILGLLMLLTAGAMLAARANELAFLFLSLELVSIPTYALLFLGRHDRAGSEATLKYFFLSIFASALLLYGMSFVYGAAGTTWLTAAEGGRSIRGALAGPSSGLMTFGLALVVAGLGFKIAAAPFHFYAPDVYEGTTHTNAALLSVAPKIAGFAAVLRLLVVGLSAMPGYAWQIALVIAALTMTVGNVCALWQSNVRRMMAYSSIAHAGYMLIGIAAAAHTGGSAIAFGGAAATTFYLAVYALATIGLFAVISDLGDSQRDVHAIDHLAGLSNTHPWHAAAATTFLFSLAGIPPLAGFWGKLTLFMSALSVFLEGAGDQAAPWFLALAIIAALNAAVAAAYYLRVVGVMYFRPPGVPWSTSASPGRYATLAAVALSALLVVGIGLHQSSLSDWAVRADRGLWTTPQPATSATSPPSRLRSLADERELTNAHVSLR